MVGFLFGQGTDTPTAQELALKRARIEAMSQQAGSAAPANVGEGIAAIGKALFSRIGDRRLDPKEDAERARVSSEMERIMQMLGGSPMGNGMPSGGGMAPPVAPPMGAPVPPVSTGPIPAPVSGPAGMPMGNPSAPLPPQIGAAVDRVAPLTGGAGVPVMAGNPGADTLQTSLPPLSPDFQAVQPGIFAGESGGDYNALFGYSQRPGGQFAGTNLTDMTVNEALQFSDPSGPYGQWVKGQVGRVATPMGAYQVVGTTLRAARDGLGLTGNEQMTPELQDQIGQWIYQNQGTGAWEGYRPGATMADVSGGGGTPTMRGDAGSDTLGTSAPNMQIIAQLAEMAGNPYATDGQRMIAQMLMQQQVGQMMQTPESMSPLEQIQLEQAQLNLEQDRSGLDNGGTVINNNIPGAPEIGTIPQGYEVFTNDQGQREMRAIPGGPEDVAPQAEVAAQQQEQQANIVVGAIDDIMAKLDSGWGLPEVGIVGAKLADWGLNQQAVDVREQLKTVQGAVAFDRLQAMREASPTGGALGAVSDTEMALLSSTLGSLSNLQSEEALKSALTTIKDIMAKFATYPGEGGGENGAGPTDEELLQMYGAP